MLALLRWMQWCRPSLQPRPRPSFSFRCSPRFVNDFDDGCDYSWITSTDPASQDTYSVPLVVIAVTLLQREESLPMDAKSNGVFWGLGVFVSLPVQSIWTNIVSRSSDIFHVVRSTNTLELLSVLRCAWQFGLMLIAKWADSPSLEIPNLCAPMKCSVPKG